MTDVTFEAELRELYDGELLGEVFFEKLLSLFEDPTQIFKLTVALQLETETKARLRPFLVSAGMDLNDDGEARRTGSELANNFVGKSWPEAMTSLLEVLNPAVQRYQQIADQAPAEYRELADSMLIHEESLLQFVVLELEGNADSVGAMSELLVNKVMIGRG